jgi:hypothetical protein
MLKSIKHFLVGILLGASTATALAMVAVGYSDRLDPVDHPLLACLGMTFPFFVVANLVILVLWVLFKWKYVWIPLLAFAFAYVPIRNYAPIHFGSEKPKDCIKIMSYNVCGYGGNFRYDNAYDTIYSYLKKVDADIVCIQEEQNTKINQFTFFKKQQGMILKPVPMIVHIIPFEEEGSILRSTDKGVPYRLIAARISMDVHAWARYFR